MKNHRIFPHIRYFIEKWEKDKIISHEGSLYRIISWFDESLRDKIIISGFEFRYRSKIYFFHLHLSIFDPKGQILKNTHNLICGKLEIGKLLGFIRRWAQVWFFVLHSIVAIQCVFSLKPNEKLLICLIWLEGVENFGLLT